MPGPSSDTVMIARPASRSSASSAATCVPSGVWTRAFASRFTTTWCRRGASPIDLDRLVGQVDATTVVGAGGVGVAHRVDQQQREVDRVPVELAALVEPGEQQQVLDERGHPRRPPTRCGRASA